MVNVGDIPYMDANGYVLILDLFFIFKVLFLRIVPWINQHQTTIWDDIFGVVSKHVHSKFK